MRSSSLACPSPRCHVEILTTDESDLPGQVSPGKLDHLYNEEMLRRAFPTYELLDLKTYVREIKEGHAHVGMSGLVGYVGRKQY